MKMSFIIIVSLALTLGACGNKKSGGSGQGADGDKKEEVKKVTKAEHCVGGRPATTLRGVWQTEFESPNIRLRLNFDFRNSFQMEVVNECMFRSGNLSSSVRVAYSADMTNIVVPQSANHIERWDGMTCEVNVAKGSIRYTFENSCLIMIDPNGDKLYLTPAF